MQDDPLSHPDLSLPEIGAMPAADLLVLTVNNRLSRRLTLELAGLLRQERQVSELPRILPLSAWLAESANELAFEDDEDVPAYRLDSFATQLVWTEAIRAEEAERVLLDASQAARLSMDADLLMDEWTLQVPSGADTDEYRGFARWRQRYRKALAAIDAEDANQGYARVLRALEDGRLAVPGQLVLAGFTDLSPRFRRLLRAFEDQGCLIAQWRDTQQAPATPRRFEAADHGAEWRAAAEWAAGQLAQHPTGRYAIVSPQLEAESPFARRILSQALAGRDGAPAFAFNVAVGRPLDEWPMARAALAWLRALAECAAGKGCAVEVLGAALLAGHCAGDVSERARLAAIDARWRRRGQVHVGAAEWRKQLAALPPLAQAWDQAMEIWTRGGARASCDVWMLRMKAALTALGFPGEGVLDSVGYQALGALGKPWAVSPRWRPPPASWAAWRRSICCRAWRARLRSSRSAILGAARRAGPAGSRRRLLGRYLDTGPDRRRAACLAQAESVAAPGGAAPGQGAARHARTRTRMGRGHLRGVVPLRAAGDRQPCAHGRRTRTAAVAADRRCCPHRLAAGAGRGRGRPAAGIAGRYARTAAGGR